MDCIYRPLARYFEVIQVLCMMFPRDREYFAKEPTNRNLLVIGSHFSKEDLGSDRSAKTRATRSPALTVTLQQKYRISHQDRTRTERVWY